MNRKNIIDYWKKTSILCRFRFWFNQWDSRISVCNFQKPTLTYFRPNKGIAAGNTTITITGKNITFQGTHRYYVAFCNGTTCI